MPKSTLTRRKKNDSPTWRDARVSRSTPGGGQLTPGASSGTGRVTSELSSRSANKSWTRTRNAGSPWVTGATTSDRIRPCVAGMSSQRQDRPLRSGRVPGAAGGTAKRPSFMAASAHARPPPENIAKETFFEDPKRATCTSRACSRTTDTGTSAARSSRPRSSRVQDAVAASAARATSASRLETAKLAPSPPKTNGNLRPSSAFEMAAMTDCACGIHRLVAARPDRLGRAHDIG